MQIFIHSPTAFIGRYTDKLLPDWQNPVASVLIILQHPTCDLLHRTHQSEVQKDRLRESFLVFGSAIVSELQCMGYLADIFDPKTGWPICSSPGSLRLDDVAVVSTCLGYASTHVSGCSVLIHPDWGSAVYPSVLVSSAPPTIVEQVVRSVITPNSVELWGGLAESDSTRRSLSEYHHALMG